MADLVTLQTQLTEAQTALHSVITGSGVTRVTIGDKQIDYNAMDLTKLTTYVQYLQSQVDAAGGSTTAIYRRALLVEL